MRILMKTVVEFLTVSLALSAICPSALAADGLWETPKKKIVASSWDLGCATIEEVAAQADLFDETGLDGVVVRVPYVTDAGGKRIRLADENGDLESTHVTEAAFGRYVPILRKMTAEHASLKHSFLGCNWSPVNGHRISWTNDAAWAQFAANMKVLASVAKRGGLVGICADAEDYGNIGQFWRKSFEPPFGVTGPLARERGRQIGRAMFGEFPEMRVLSFWFLSLNKSYANSDDPVAVMRAEGDLWPMFINGLLDVMPPAARLVDGDEHGYWYRTGLFEYERENVRMLTRALALIAPENRGKYRSQLQVGFGLYLDEYINPKKTDYRTKNGSAVEGFREQLGEALYAADEYVWLWGEKQRWIKWANLRIPYGWMKIGKETWEERLPGLAQMLREAKDPQLEAVRLLDARRAAGVTNLVEKSLLGKGSNWQNEKRSHGTFTPLPGKGHDGGTAVLAENVASGCFLFGSSRKAAEGEAYVAEAYARGDGVGTFTVRWKKDGTWNWNMPGTDAAFGAPDAKGWRRASIKFRVPHGVNEPVLKINLAQQEGQKAAFDRIVLYKVD